MRILLIFCLGLISTEGLGAKNCAAVLQNQAQASPPVMKEGSLEFAPNHKVYYRYIQKKKNKKTLVLLNGLIYKNKYWDDFIKVISGRGYNIVQISYSTHPESIQLLEGEQAHYAGTPAIGDPSPVSLESLAEEVEAVVDHLGLKKFELVTLSYSSSVGMNLSRSLNDRINQIFLLSPAVRSSHRNLPGGEEIHRGFAAQMANPLGAWNPLWKTTVEFNYDVMVKTGMFQRMSSKKHQADYVPEGLSFNEFFEGTFQMGRAVKWFELGPKLAEENLPRVNLITAGEESPSDLRDMLAAWDQAAPTRRGSVVLMEKAPHIMVATHPKSTAEVLDRLLSQPQDSSSQELRFDSEGYEKDGGEGEGYFGEWNP